MDISWQNHPAIEPDSVNPITLDACELLEKIAIHWQQTPSTTWLTCDQARLLNNLETLLLLRSGKYHQRQNERSSARQSNREAPSRSAAICDVDTNYPFISHSFELKAPDVAFLHELAEHLPSPLKAQIKAIEANQVAHIDTWLSLILTIRQYTTRRFLMTLQT